jgi:2,5-furandicarboxylate decarboxylase 1
MGPHRDRPGCYDDLNDFLEALSDQGDLIRIAEQVSPRFEISAILEGLAERDGPAALMTDVAEHPGNVVAGNVMGHRRRIASSLGVEEAHLTDAYLERKESRIEPTLTDVAPIKAVSVPPEELDLLSLLPALVHHEEDASPYLTCAVTFARNPETGLQTMGLHRIQIQSGTTLGIFLGTPPLAHFLHKAREMERPLEVAVVIGPDPAVLIASVTWCPEGNDKIEIAGGLRQKPVEMTRCETVNLNVPAHAQYVIEGSIAPGHTDHEGLFGDSSGTYVEAQSPVMRATGACHREEPIYQALQPWSSEDDALMNLCFGSDLLENVRKDYPFVLDLHLAPGTVAAHVVLAVRPVERPAIRSAMASVLTRNPFVKKVIVVDDDIDIRNQREVEWALASRFQADRDLMRIEGVQGSVIDPSRSPDGSTCKIGIDATYQREFVGRFKKIAIPMASRKKARDILETALQND